MSEETTKNGSEKVMQALALRAEDKLSAAPNKGSSILLASTLKEALEEQEILRDYIRKAMKEGVDFGVIPGTQTKKGEEPKKALLKPGAEKLLALFRCTPKFKIVERIEEWNAPEPFFRYLFKVVLTNRATGDILAEGFGEANSHESKYRWRNAKRKCPKCGAETIFKSKNDPGFYCYGAVGGCGAQFPDPKDPAIIGQVIGKVLNENVADVVNAILKIAKKRALIDGALALSRCSDMFHADIGDEDDAPLAPEPPPPPDDWAAAGDPNAKTLAELRQEIVDCKVPADILKVAEKCKVAPEAIRPVLRKLWEERRAAVAEADVARQRKEREAKDAARVSTGQAEPGENG